MRNLNGKNYVTPVKAQEFGDCWSFSLASAAEISYLYANDMGVPAGEKNDKVNFSEKYNTWYIFHGITKDDTIKGRVRASQTGEGFDPGEAEKSASDEISYIIGGPFVQNSLLYGSGFGPVDESVKVNNEYPYAYDDSSSFKWTLPVNAQYRNPPTDAFLRSSLVLPTTVGEDEKGDYVFNEEGLNAIKSEIYKGHGVTIALNANHSEMNYKNMAVYYTGNKNPNHAVSVVGYDDDYPKEKFGRKSDGKIIEGSIPPGNGALIIKNSWGTRDNGKNDIDDGYFYLSYYDHSIQAPFSFEFDNVSSEKHTERNFDQYDLMMTKWYGYTDSDKEIKTANVFDAEEDESLYQIAYRTASDKTEVKYEIYRDIKNNDPSSGQLLETGISRHTFAGYYKIDLKDEVQLKKGDRYSVVLTMRRAADENENMVYTEVFPYSTEFFEGMTVKGIINEGESYFCIDGKWSDMSSRKDELAGKAFEQCSEEYKTNKSLPEFELKGKDKFTVDNYPIKTILAPAKNN